MSSHIGPGRPKSMINVRVDTQTKQALEANAQAENLDLSSYIRKHYAELIGNRMITAEEDVKIANPGLNSAGYPGNYAQPPFPYVAPAPIYPTQVPPSYPPYLPQYPPFHATFPPGYQPGGDAIDQLVNELRKILMAKMVMDLLRGKDESLQALLAAKGEVVTKKSAEDMSMKDIMQMQMVMNMQDRQYQQQIAAANQQLEAARGRGDKQGENNALQLITALATSQAQQSQNFMQQLMLANQNATSVQQTLFSTALSSNRASEESSRQERQAFQQQVESVRSQMSENQLASLQKMNEVQMSFLQKELERIRNEPRKDMLSQLAELDALRKTSPILDAAFKQAFNVKEGGGIGEIIPKLKELGIDKVIDTIGSAVGNFIGGGGAGAAAVPPPTPEVPGGQPASSEIPIPVGEPSDEELSRLRLPPSEREPEPAKEPDAVPLGYSNLSVGAPTNEPQSPVQQPAPQPQQQPTPPVTTPAAPPSAPVGYTNLTSAQTTPAPTVPRSSPVPSPVPTQPAIGYSNLEIQNAKKKQPDNSELIAIPTEDEIIALPPDDDELIPVELPSDEDEVISVESPEEESEEPAAEEEHKVFTTGRKKKSDSLPTTSRKKKKPS